MSELRISTFQQNLLSLPLDIQGIFLPGGKGGAKSYGAMLLAFQWCDLYREKARVLVLRRHYPDLEGLVAAGLSILTDIYGGKAARKMWNGSDYFFRLPNGGYVQLGGLGHEHDALRYRGRSWNMLVVDEVAMYSGPKLPNLVRAELRGGPGVRPRIVYTANPGLEGHDWLDREFIRNHKSWVPWTERETGLTWITCPSTAADNPFLDFEEHHRQIAAIAQNDKDLALALQTGDWGALKSGEFFGGAWKERNSVIRDWPFLPDYGWRYFLSIDHGGGSAPTVALFCALAMEWAYGPFNDQFPAGSLVIFDEVTDAVEGDWNETEGHSIAKNCDAIKETADFYEMKPSGLIDPQVDQDHGDDTKLHDAYTANGVSVTGWKKHRREAGAALVRELMHHAARPSHRSRSGLYVCQRCHGTLGTLPLLPRSRTNRNDVDTNSADHWFDALKGAAHYKRESFSFGKLVA